MSLTIVVCGNDAYWKDRDKYGFINTCLDMRCASFDVEINDDFRHWNGGPGHRHLPAYVHLDGYGPVHSMDGGRAAIAFMLSGGGNTPESRVPRPDAWPSSSELEAALDCLESIVDMHREFQETP